MPKEKHLLFANAAKLGKGRGKGAFTGYLSHMFFLLAFHRVSAEVVLTCLLAFLIAK